MPAIIFDMDGVITDTERLHGRAEREILEPFGLQVPLEEWNGFRGRTEPDIFAYLFEKYGGHLSEDEKPEIDDLIAAKTDVYIRLCQAEMPLVPGSVDFIRKAKEYFGKVGLATSSNGRVQKAAFDRYDLWPHFDDVTTGDDVQPGHGKPHPEIYQIASRRAGHNPADCLVLEDSDNGVRAATAAGCRAVGITTSFDSPYLKECGALATVDSYAEFDERILKSTLFN